MKNIFDCLTCCVDDLEGKEKYLEAEGVELSLIMLREGKASKPPAVRLLNHALGGPDGVRCCERLVEAAGLKTVFSLYGKRSDKEAREHILGILLSLLRSLPANSDQRIRLLAKFQEKNWRVIDNLVQTRRELYSSVAMIDKEIAEKKNELSADEQEELADEWLSRRLDAGLFSLQTVDTILAWLVAEDENAKNLVIDTLADRGEGLEVIKKTIQGKTTHVSFQTVADNDADQLDSIEASGENQDPIGKDMLVTLVTFL